MSLFLISNRTIRLSFILASIFSAAVITSPSQSASPHVTIVSASVTDKAGRDLSDLRQQDFILLEDDKPMRVVSFSKLELPVSYGLIVDTTGSMRPLG